MVANLLIPVCYCLSMHFDNFQNVLLQTKRHLGKRLLGPSSVKMVKAKVVIKRQSLHEKLGLGIAIENDESTNR